MTNTAGCLSCHGPVSPGTKHGLCRSCCMRVVTNRMMAESSKTCSVDGCGAKIRDHNQTWLCQTHGKMRCHRGMTKSLQAENDVESWTPDPTRPERRCQWCRRAFHPAGPFNRYFCSPVCQTEANRELGYAYRAEQVWAMARRGVRA